MKISAETYLLQIEDLINEKKDVYQRSNGTCISDYNGENGLAADYNGRQILELLQNADDAGSVEVLIDFNKQNNLLSIANEGEEFTVEGIRSLMISNLSTKTNRKFIGNKGLGFRSVLNWADKIKIRSNGCVIEFSPEIAKNEFHSLIPEESKRSELLASRNLSKDTIPFPILAIPRVILDKDNGHKWTTIIEITYKDEFETDIEEQLAYFTNEILLFINNIKKVEIKGLEDDVLCFERGDAIGQGDNFEIIPLKDINWHIIEEEKELPKEFQEKKNAELEFYSIKVATVDDFNFESKLLYSFFPTNLNIHLPCIIHGTFELDTSRNHLRNSKKNKYIFDRIAHLLEKRALELANESTDWRPYLLLAPTSIHSDSKMVSEFYDNLETIRKNAEIYPCTNNKYCKLNEIKYYSSEFSNWLLSNKYGDNFENLLLDKEEIKPKLNYYHNDKYPPEILQEKINTISNSIQGNDIHKRAEFISLLKSSVKVEENYRFSLFTNDQDKLIDVSNVAYTPFMSEVKIVKPDFVNIDFMNKPLYELLRDKHQEEINNTRQKDEAIPRVFQRIFRSVANVLEYDSNNIISKIIAETRKHIKELNKDDAHSAIKQMVTALFSTYNLLQNKQEKFSDTCPLINKNGEIAESSELYLSESYPSGKNTVELYEGVLSESDYLNEYTAYFNISDNVEQIENFFIWLGINRYLKYKPLEYKKEAWEKDGYFAHVFSDIEKPDPVSRFYFKGEALNNIDDTIANLNCEKLVWLILIEDKIRQSLDYYNKDVLDYQYSNHYDRIISKPSYILYQLRTTFNISKYVIGDYNQDILEIINDGWSFDYNYLISKGFKKTQINDILFRLGAKESFNDIDTARVYEILLSLKKDNVDPYGKTTQRIYKLALENFVTTNAEPDISEELELFSKKDNTNEYKKFTEVFYSDNSTLPKRIIKNLWILNLPKRLGENNVSKYFGVKNFKDFEVKIDQPSLIKHAEFNAFSDFFEEIKPLILTYRLSVVKNADTKKSDANSLKSCKIQLVTKCKYFYDKDVPEDIDYFEFINDNNTFHIKVHPSFKLDQIRKHSMFCDAFAEVMCITFKVNDHKNDFRNVIRNDISDTKHVLEEDQSSEIAEAYRLLGISKNEIDFWKFLFKLKNQTFPEHIATSKELSTIINEVLSIKLPKNYSSVSFDGFDNIESSKFIEFLINEHGFIYDKLIESDKILQGMVRYHQSVIPEKINNIDSVVDKLIWKSLKDKSIEEKMRFHLISKEAIQSIEKQVKDQVKDASKKSHLPDYSQIVSGVITKLYGTDNITDIPDLTEIYNRNYECIGKPLDIDEEKRDLLFFHWENLNELKSIVCLVNENEKEVNQEKEVNLDEVELVESSTEAIHVNDTSGKGTGGGGSAYDSSGDKEKRIKGKAAEKLVRDKLMQLNYYNVTWVSGNSDNPKRDDSLGYDIRYTDKNGDEKFVEVKSVSSDHSFFLTENERKCGVKNREKYIIALVAEKKIHFITDFFKFSESESFETNSKYTTRNHNYKIYFKIEEKENK
jgi:hypothetical protein